MVGRPRKVAKAFGTPNTLMVTWEASGACTLRANPHNWRTHPQAQREVNAGDFATSRFNGYELTLRKDLPMIVKFFDGVGRLRGIDELAKRNNRVIVRGSEAADSIVGRQHGRYSDRRRPTNQAIAVCVGCSRLQRTDT